MSDSNELNMSAGSRQCQDCKWFRFNDGKTYCCAEHGAWPKSPYANSCEDFQDFFSENAEN